MSFSSDAPLVSNQVVNEEFPDTYEEFIKMFEVSYGKLSDAVNSKEGGTYLLNEIATFQKYFNVDDPQNNRNIYRKVINFGALPNATTKSIQHDIQMDPNTIMTRIYGAATNPQLVKFLPLPFASPTLVNNVSLEVDDEKVTIETGIDRSEYTEVTIVLEYSKG